ncbi:MAG: hypothetical protein HY730_03750 [Candidatus Tectomicrobia bacterium]|uniref:UGSC-like domain-containing protein n=1 Tax=Tectimicrobiota bacterium TaxID=2528274 RepID=A0A933GMW7_UNCTE|nr:hypothetical protein [Candidatus Tectomicrobia bacterium]
MTEKIIVLNPVAKARVEETPLAPRLQSLEGKKIGFLDNIKANVALLLANIEQALTAKYNFSEVVHLAKKEYPSTAGPAPEWIIKDLSQCDLVINALGD